MATLLGINIQSLSESSLVRTFVCLCLFNFMAFPLFIAFNIFIVILISVVYWFYCDCWYLGI